jgi:hypothetical protein
MQEAARLVSNLQAESDGVDLLSLLRETPREAYAFQQLGVSTRCPPLADATQSIPSTRTT